MDSRVKMKRNQKSKERKDEKLIRIAISDEKYEKEAECLAERIHERYGSPDDGGISVDIVYNRGEFSLENDEILTMKHDAGALTLIKGKLSLKPDFLSMLPRLRQSNLEREYLVKAARIKGIKPEELTVADATAGLGEDSLILAAAGYSVEMYEHDPIIAALLRDRLRRAAFVPELAGITARMSLHEKDSISALYSCTAPEPLCGTGAPQKIRPDIILLDPMFPERQKSASVKKKFQLLHLLENPADDEESLLKAAFAAAPRKIIIKRPLKGPFLASRKPDYSISGKAVRYDCFINPKDYT